MTKKCKKCDRVLPFERFARHAKRKDGLQVSCRDCMKKMNATHYQLKYKNKQVSCNKINRQENRRRIYLLKLKNPCPCGEADPVCLDFHHTEGKDQGIARMLGNTLGWETIQTEIDKCCVLCSNCHRKLHAKSKLPFDLSLMKLVTGI